MIVYDVGSVFSGSGGIELGLENTKQFKTKWFVENNPYKQVVLRKNFPGVPIYSDIREIDWSKVPRVDVIAGGFPCKNISNAGDRTGIKGKHSSLWSEFARAIEGTKPKWVIIENVSALVRRGLGTILAELRRQGYKALRPILIEAASVGAPHKRERIFIVAYSDNGSGKSFPLPAGRDSFGFSNSALESSNVEGDEDASRRTEGVQSSKLESPDSQESGLERRNSKERLIALSRQWEVEPDVGRVADGVPAFVDRIICLGDAVVPQVAQVVGEAILYVEQEGGAGCR